MPILSIKKTTLLLNLLGDNTRLTMLKMLESHDYCVCEFVAVFHISQPAISQHIRKLKDAGLVKETRKGQWIIYSLNKASDSFEFIDRILQFVPNQDFKLDALIAQGLRISCEK